MKAFANNRASTAGLEKGVFPQGEVAKHVAEWFDDLAIIDRDGVTPHREFKFGALLYGMVRAELDELSPQIPTQLFHGALRGRRVPLPQVARAAALRRQQFDQDDKLKSTRLALIKACLLRSPNKPNPNIAISEKLNESTTDPACLCGRLFAVFDRLQYLALRGVNAGVVERYYASASVTPALVVGRLFRNAQFHLAKADAGAAENVRKVSRHAGPRSPRPLRPRLLPPKSRLPPTEHRAKGSRLISNP